MKSILPKHIEKLLKQELNGTLYEDPKKYQQFVDACRLGVRVIEEKTPAKKIAIGTSKIGGMPDMPKHMPWPSFTENTVDYDIQTNEMKECPHVHPLLFLAQINCAELPPYMTKLGFPKKGILYFFVNDDTQRLFYLKDESKARVRVLYFDGPTKELAESWVLANLEGESLEGLGEDEIVGYGVDSGCGSFVDAQFEKTIREKVDGFLDSTLSDEKLYVLFTEEKAIISMAAFNSGYGDGVYGSFWGLDKEGNIAALATDFDVLTLAKENK